MDERAMDTWIEAIMGALRLILLLLASSRYLVHPTGESNHRLTNITVRQLYWKFYSNRRPRHALVFLTNRSVVANNIFTSNAFKGRLKFFALRKLQFVALITVIIARTKREFSFNIEKHRFQCFATTLEIYRSLGRVSSNRRLSLYFSVL